MYQRCDGESDERQPEKTEEARRSERPVDHVVWSVDPGTHGERARKCTHSHCESRDPSDSSPARRDGSPTGEEDEQMYAEGEEHDYPRGVRNRESDGGDHVDVRRRDRHHLVLQVR